jgi:hypothetical protein
VNGIPPCLLCHGAHADHVLAIAWTQRPATVADITVAADLCLDCLSERAVTLAHLIDLARRRAARGGNGEGNGTART